MFLFGVAVMLGATAVIVAASNGPPAKGSLNPSRDSIWIYCLGCAVPVTLLAFHFARSALVRPVVGAVGTLLAVVVLAAAGDAFRAYGNLSTVSRRRRMTSTHSWSQPFSSRSC
ncbi:MAG: hypothetical protein WAL31_10715 [Gaiellaceae bacterium]